MPELIEHGAAGAGHGIAGAGQMLKHHWLILVGLIGGVLVLFMVLRNRGGSGGTLMVPDASQPTGSPLVSPAGGGLDSMGAGVGGVGAGGGDTQTPSIILLSLAPQDSVTPSSVAPDASAPVVQAEAATSAAAPTALAAAAPVVQPGTHPATQTRVAQQKAAAPTGPPARTAGLASPGVRPLAARVQGREQELLDRGTHTATAHHPAPSKAPAASHPATKAPTPHSALSAHLTPHAVAANANASRHTPTASAPRPRTVTPSPHAATSLHTPAPAPPPKRKAPPKPPPKKAPPKPAPKKVVKR